MISYSVIQKSQLEGAMRIDAEYYQPEFLELVSKIKSQKSVFLGSLGAVVYGTTPEGGFFETEGVPFMRSQNFSNIMIDDSDLVFCSNKFHAKNKKSEVKSGDILFAAVGATIGDLAIVQSDILEGNINQNIARFRVANEKLNPYFVGLFFASRYGQFQIKRLITGNAQPYLNSEQINFLQVPILERDKQDEIGQYFSLIQKQTNNSKKYYQQAENLLLEELKLKDLDVEENLSAVVNFSDIMEARRMDAEYFQPKYAKLISKIETQNHKRLGDLVSMKKGIEIGAEQYQDEGKLFIRVSSMGKFEINGGDQKYLSEKLYDELKSDFQPQVGEILLTKDASPGIAYVLKENIEGIISGGTLRLNLKEKIEAEYLALCLNSIIGQMQAERDAGGSVIAHWKPEQIKNIVIPILPEVIQQKIAELVRESHEARKKAKLLLDEAKAKIESMIENSAFNAKKMEKS